MIRHVSILGLLLLVSGPVLLGSLAHADEEDMSRQTEGVVDKLTNLKNLKDQTTPVKFKLRGRLIWRNPSGYLRLEIGKTSRSFRLEPDTGELWSALAEYSVGDLLEVSGCDRSGPIMNVASLDLIQEGEPSDLRKVPAFRNSKPAVWRYVEHMAFVREVLELEDGFRLALGDDDVIVMCNQRVPKEELEKWLGQILRVEGAALLWENPINPATRIVHVGVIDPSSQIKHLYIRNPKSLTKTNPDPKSKPNRKPKPKPTPAGVVGLKDVVVEHVAPTFIAIDGRRISTAMASHISVGSVVNLRARRSKTDDQLDSIWISRTGGIRPVEPPTKTVRQIVEEGCLNRRVSLKGTVEQCFVTESRLELLLKSGGKNVVVKMPVPEERKQIDQFARHSVARVSGLVYSIKPDSDDVIELDVSSSDDVIIAKSPLQLQPGQVQWAVGGAAVAVALLLAWYWTLNQQVRNKTRELSSSTSRIVAASEAVRDGMLIFDAKSCVSLASDKVGEAIGIEIPPGTSQSRTCAIIQNALRDGHDFAMMWIDAFQNPHAIVEREFALKATGNVSVYSAPIFDHRQRPDGRIWTFENITQRRKLEEETLQSRKLSAVGRLAGGVAHDFNNLLQVIGTNVALIQHASAKPEVETKFRPLEEVSAAVNRGADLTRQLLTFARTSDVRCEPTNINELLERTAAILDRTLGEHIRLSLSLSIRLPLAEIDAGQLEQVIINMCLNARDAIGRKSGCIQISTQHESNRHPDPAVVIVIRDDGCGMPSEVVDKIFEPFFTTKKLDEGTGLGLATSLGAIEQMGGHIECSSTPGQGTSFRIYLPCSSSSVVDAGRLDEAKPTVVPSSLSILVVDDNAAIRCGVEILLSKLGHKTETAAGGREALSQLEGATYDVVLLDLSMPDMSGWQVLQIIRQKHPAQKVIICSGYSSEADQQMTANVEPDAYLDKPYQLEALCRALAGISSSQFSDAQDG